MGHTPIVKGYPLPVSMRTPYRYDTMQLASSVSHSALIKTRQIISDVLLTESIQDGFGCFFLDQDAINEEKMRNYFAKFRDFYMTIRDMESQLVVVRTFIDAIFAQKNPKRSEALLKVLNECVENKLIPTKLLCETLLNNPQLSFEDFRWVDVLGFIRRFIGAVYYKGVRDLFRSLLDKSQKLPTPADTKRQRHYDVLVDLVAYILDRDSCLLPAYLALNEVAKMGVGQNPWPYQQLGDMLSQFVDQFKPVAQMVSLAGRPDLCPIIGHPCFTMSVWKLQPVTLSLLLPIGRLPYDKDFQFGAQTKQVSYLLSQPFGREIDTVILQLQRGSVGKQRLPLLEKHLVSYIISILEQTQRNPNRFGPAIWDHVSSVVIFYVLFQYINFAHLVLQLRATLLERGSGVLTQQGGVLLMWILLQFVSGSIQKPAAAKDPSREGTKEQTKSLIKDFLPVLHLIDFLFDCAKPLPVPTDLSSPVQSAHYFSVASIWLHLMKANEFDTDGKQPPPPTPLLLTDQIKFLDECLTKKEELQLTDTTLILLCNAYSTNSDHLTVLMQMILANLYSDTFIPAPNHVQVLANAEPLPLSFLDALTVHVKMSLISYSVHKLMRVAAQSPCVIGPPPALLETYSRLLMYNQLEHIGMKGFSSQVLVRVCQGKCWPVYQALLEIICHRLQHIQAAPKLAILTTLQSHPPSHPEMYESVEFAVISLLQNLQIHELSTHMSRPDQKLNIPSVFILPDSEEINRIFVLTLARVLHVTGYYDGFDHMLVPWPEDMLKLIMQYTPHQWSSLVTAHFPGHFARYFTSSRVVCNERQAIRSLTEREVNFHRDSADYFSELLARNSQQQQQQQQQCVVLCTLWRLFLDIQSNPAASTNLVNHFWPVLVKLKMYTSHLRNFCDLIIFDFSMKKYPNENLLFALHSLIWAHGVISLDRFLMFLLLRASDIADMNVWLLITHHLVCVQSDIRDRVDAFTSLVHPDHWLCENNYDSHCEYHRKFPETKRIEPLRSAGIAPLPVYYSNVCLRLLPLMDICIHRIIEMDLKQHVVLQQFHDLLSVVGPLYRYHKKSISYLYNTFHYYNVKLTGFPQIKTALVDAILGPNVIHRPQEWQFTEAYENYLRHYRQDNSFYADKDYFSNLISRLVDTITGNPPLCFSQFDWRYKEFSNQSVHAFHMTCVEILALPIPVEQVVNAFIEIALASEPPVKEQNIGAWRNAIGLVLAGLPSVYWNLVHERVAFSIKDGLVSDYVYVENAVFEACQQQSDSTAHRILALVHALWQHFSSSQISVIHKFVRDRIKPIIKNESDFLFVCHLIGPFLHRLYTERTRCCMDLTVSLYEILVQVDKAVDKLVHVDPITDFLYHIKYMFVGDSVRADLERLLGELSPTVRQRLRFIAHPNARDEPTPTTCTPVVA